MNYTLIMLDNPILVSDEKIKDVRPYIGKYHYEKGLVINKFPTYLTDLSECKLIIASIDDSYNVPKLDLSLIAEGIGWVDVEKLAWKTLFPKWDSRDIVEQKEQDYLRSFVMGFKAAQSLNEKKYSDEDLFNLLKMVHDKRLDSLSARIVDNGRVTDFNFWNSYSKKEVYASELISEFIQSLPKPKEYLVELNFLYQSGSGYGEIPSNFPIITNNTIIVTKIIK